MCLSAANMTRNAMVQSIDWAILHDTCRIEVSGVCTVREQEFKCKQATRVRSEESLFGHWSLLALNTRAYGVD